MPRYNFRIFFGDRLIADPFGDELPDLDAARAVAVIALRHHTATFVVGSHGAAAAGGRFEITDEHGRLLTTVRVGDAAGQH